MHRSVPCSADMALRVISDILQDLKSDKAARRKVRMHAMWHASVEGHEKRHISTGD